MSRLIFPIQHDLAGLPGAHYIEALVNSQATHIFPVDAALFYIQSNDLRQNTFCKFKAIVIQICDYNTSCTAVLRDHRGHDADWSRSGNQHVFADHIERQSGMHRIAEWVKTGQQLS